MSELAVLEVRLRGRLVGTLTRLPDDRNLFAFSRDYIEDPDRPTLSLSLKDVHGNLITDVRPTPTRLPAFFANLLPEGALRDYLAARAQVKPGREFFLAGLLGGDLPGAIQIVPADGRFAFPDESADDTARDPASDDDGLLGFSLAGVQLKFSAVREASGGLAIPADGVGGSWIVKLPSTRFAGVPENEYAMMSLARRVGIDVPETKLVPLRKVKGLPREVEIAGDTAFAIRRFDRTGPAGGTSPERIHIEDFAQVFGVYPEQKYDKASYRNIAKVLWIEAGETAIAEFVRRLVFNALIGNADMHLKNWSLIYPDGRAARLSPAYDFVATIAWLRDEKMALNLVDKKAFASVSRHELARFAQKAGISQKLTLDTAEETVARFATEWRSADIARSLRAVIGAHLRGIPLWKEIAAPKA